MIFVTRLAQTLLTCWTPRYCFHAFCIVLSIDTAAAGIKQSTKALDLSNELQQQNKHIDEMIENRKENSEPCWTQVSSITFQLSTVHLILDNSVTSSDKVMTVFLFKEVTFSIYCDIFYYLYVALLKYMLILLILKSSCGFCVRAKWNLEPCLTPYSLEDLVEIHILL
jgi:hypothetical protein